MVAKSLNICSYILVFYSEVFMMQYTFGQKVRNGLLAVLVAGTMALAACGPSYQCPEATSPHTVEVYGAGHGVGDLVPQNYVEITYCKSEGSNTGSDVYSMLNGGGRVLSYGEKPGFGPGLSSLGGGLNTEPGSVQCRQDANEPDRVYCFGMTADDIMSRLDAYHGSE
jgi:hypothetical protein